MVKKLTLPLSDEEMEVVTEACVQANANIEYMRKELVGLPPVAFQLAMNLGSFIVHCSMNGIDLVKYEVGSLPRELDQAELAKLRVDFVKQFMGRKSVDDDGGATPAYVNQG